MRQLAVTGMAAVLAMLAITNSTRAASHAASVVDYIVGDGAAVGYDQPSAALGEPTRFTGVGVFPGAVTPFNPPFLSTEVVSIGEGGSLTLQLANYVLPVEGQLDLGVFTNTGLIETDFPHGQAADPLSPTDGTFGADQAVLEVSADGQTWVSLGERWFDIPTIGYSDVTNPFATEPGAIPSDFGQPFASALDDLAGLKYHDPVGNDILDVYAGSGGGSWVDLSTTGLAQIGWVRFSVPDDGDGETQNKFELDGVAIANGAVGPAVPEPATVGIAVIGALAMCVFAKRGRV